MFVRINRGKVTGRGGGAAAEAPENEQAEADHDRFAGEGDDELHADIGVDDDDADDADDELPANSSGPQSSAAPPPHKSSPEPEARAEQRKYQRPSRDYMKPQFIDFESPLLLQLFVRLPTALKQYFVYLEEEYPPATSLPIVEGHPHAAEYVIQMNWKSVE